MPLRRLNHTVLKKRGKVFFFVITTTSTREAGTHLYTVDGQRVLVEGGGQLPGLRQGSRGSREGERRSGGWRWRRHFKVLHVVVNLENDGRGRSVELKLEGDGLVGERKVGVEWVVQHSVPVVELGREASWRVRHVGAVEQDVEDVHEVVGGRFAAEELEDEHAPGRQGGFKGGHQLAVLLQHKARTVLERVVTGDPEQLAAQSHVALVGEGELDRVITETEEMVVIAGKADVEKLVG